MNRFGQVVAESLSQGCPVISYNIEYGPSEMIDQGKNGWLVTDGNTQELADRILEVMRNPVSEKEMIKKSTDVISRHSSVIFQRSMFLELSSLWRKRKWAEGLRGGSGILQTPSFYCLSFDPSSRNPDPHLLQLIARAHELKVIFIRGGRSISEMAKEAELSPSYLTRLLRIGFLSPDHPQRKPTTTTHITPTDDWYTAAKHLEWSVQTLWYPLKTPHPIQTQTVLLTQPFEIIGTCAS